MENIIKENKNWIQEMIEMEVIPKPVRTETVVDFCKRHGISERTYYYHLKKKKNKDIIVVEQRKIYYPKYIALAQRIGSDLKNGIEKGEIIRYIDTELVLKVLFLKLLEPFVSIKKTSDNIRVRASKAYIDWRYKVFSRDKFTCKKCNKVGGKLNAHHIKPFAYFKEIRFDINNGITLCEKCHKLTENYGRKYKRA